MSAKQIMRHHVPALKTILRFYTFSARRSYGEQYKHKDIVTSLKIYHRLLRLHEPTISRFSKLSLQTVNTECNRRFSYSCRVSSHSNVDFSSDAVKKHTEHDDDDAAKKTQTADPQLASLIKHMQEDFEDESHKLHSEATAGEEQKHNMRVSDPSLSERNLNAVNVNKKDSEFEYDYQVAEDIEEYDYIDENSILEQQIRAEKVLPISLKRGETGVFDLHELVTLLEYLGATNIVTIPVPPEANFCDDMVVASVKSKRHLQAINDEMLWVHKRKKAKDDHHLVIEGKDKSDWCAMDLGNIVLHIFYGDSREFYDIESLWLLGPDRDPKCQEQSADPYVLSAEDLFWLETGQAQGKATDQDNSSTTDKDKQGNLVSAEESGKVEKSDCPDKLR